MARHQRRASIAQFRRDAQRVEILTHLVDAADAVIVKEQWLLSAVMRWRGDVAVRKPRCVSCKASFADCATVGGFLVCTPEGMSAISISAFCRVCWTGLSDTDLERAAMRVLKIIKPNARFADAPPEQ